MPLKEFHAVLMGTSPNIPSSSLSNSAEKQTNLSSDPNIEGLKKYFRDANVIRLFATFIKNDAQVRLVQYAATIKPFAKMYGSWKKKRQSIKTHEIQPFTNSYVLCPKLFLDMTC